MNRTRTDGNKNRTTALRSALISLLLLSFTATAQEACEGVPPEPLAGAGLTYNGYEPLEYAGDVTAEQVGGSVFVEVVAPTDQGVDVVLMGPDGYRQVAEVQEEALFKGLPSGVYALTATDDRLQLVVGRVAVVQHCMASLTLTLAPLEAFTYDEEAVERYETYGGYELGAYEEVGASTGTLGVRVSLPAAPADREDEGVEAQISVVGPNDYRTEGTGEAALTDLEPGVYAVSATATGYEMAQGVVIVREGQAVGVTLTLEPLFLVGDTE